MIFQKKNNKNSKSSEQLGWNSKPNTDVVTKSKPSNTSKNKKK